MSLFIPSPSPTSVSLPDELISEVLSCLTVKTLLRLRCVCKSWNSLISDPSFVKLHLNRSSQNTYITLVDDDDFMVTSIAFFPLFKKSLIFFTPPNDPHHQLNGNDNEFLYVAGSCHGLLCLSCYYCVNDNIEKTWFQIWNPATRTISQRLCFCSSWDDDDSITFPFSFTFGCDESTNTYKVVELMRTNVRVFSLRNNTWRWIQNPLVAYLYSTECPNKEKSYSAVYLSESVNWLAVHNYDTNDITIKQFVIISLDLRTETCTQLLPPPGFDKDFDEMPVINPNLSVLNDCLLLSYDFKGICYVIWQMKEFGVEDSWIQFFKISYHNLHIDDPFNGSYLLPQCVLEKNGTLFTMP